MLKKALVIGAGIHGCTVALELIKEGYYVYLIDKSTDFLTGGTSASTHNRLHLGYHYPRSNSTIAECKKAYEIFVNEYPECLYSPDFYYLIDKNNSNLTASQFEFNMSLSGLPCNVQWPNNNFINKEQLQASYITEEKCYDLNILRESIRKKLIGNDNCVIRIDFNLRSQKIQDNFIVLESSSNEFLIIENLKLIVNCTYTNTNKIQNIFGIAEDEMNSYMYEDTEVCVVSYDKAEIPALTVLDGPFITILPYTNIKNHYLVYDVENSVHCRYVSKYYVYHNSYQSKWLLMKEKGQKYYPFFKDLKYVKSLWANRPVPVVDTNDDRSTKIVKHNFPIDFYSFLEGKFTSSIMMAKMFVNSLKEKVVDGI